MLFQKGQFGKSNVEQNSLSQNLLLYPQISKKIIREYPQYSLTYFTEGLGRYAAEKLIGNNAFEWWVKGRTTRPLTATGVSSGNGLGNTAFTVEFVENYANPNDIIRFKNGQQAHVKGAPIETAGGFTYTLQLQTSESTSSLTGSNIVAGTQVGVVGNAHPEASEKGYGNLVYPDKHVNYLSICRAAGSISGSAATDITWIEENGQRLWYFTMEDDVRKDYMYQSELQMWYNLINVDANGNPKVFDLNGKPIITGDGLLAQIDGGNIGSYSLGLTEKQITNFLADLRYTNGETTAKYMVYTGTLGMREFQQAMKDYYIRDGHVLFYDADTSKPIKLGGDFLQYRAMGLDMTLVYNPLFDDPNLHHNLTSEGLPKESGKMVFTNMGQLSEGVSNVEILVKGASGISRGFVTKYIAGMIDPFNPNSIMAANSKDQFSVEYLSNKGIILRRPKSCGILDLA